MKNKFTLLMLAIALVFSLSACSDDDDKNDGTDSLIGKWKYSKVTADFKTNKPDTDAAIKKAIEDLFGADTFGETLEFKENGTMVIGDKTGDYEVKGNKITMLYGDGYATVDYLMNGNSLILYMGAIEPLEEYIQENDGFEGVELETAIAEIHYTKQ